MKVLKFRNSLARLRVSSHRLEIEVGRWARPYKPVHERLCNNCNRLEDEYHIVIECSLYNSLRRKYIDQVYWRSPSMYKFVNLITSDNTRTITNLDIYVYKHFKIRNNEMYAENNLKFKNKTIRILNICKWSNLFLRSLFSILCSSLLFSNLSVSLSMNMFQFIQIVYRLTAVNIV